jgi:hypothetical protein
MKKLMTALAICAVTGLALADGSGVTSANVVGYKTVTLKKGFNMLACNFDAVGVSTNTLDVVIPGTLPGLIGGNNSGVADDIMVFDPVAQGYSTYFLWYTTKTTGGANANNYKWVVSGATLAGVVLKSGDPFWYKSKSTTNISITATFAGEVPTTNKNITIRPGFNMIAGNYAADWDPNGLGTNYWATSGAVGGNNSGTGDDIMIFDPDAQGYTTYFLWYTTKTTGGANANNYKWVVSGATVAPTNFVKLGQGVWYKAKMASGSFVIPVTAPYSL